nr:MAG TPA: hypothetical protein [Bacteriophage sp.]
MMADQKGKKYEELDNRGIIRALEISRIYKERSASESRKGLQRNASKEKQNRTASNHARNDL